MHFGWLFLYSGSFSLYIYGKFENWKFMLQLNMNINIKICCTRKFSIKKMIFYAFGNYVFNWFWLLYSMFWCWEYIISISTIQLALYIPTHFSPDNLCGTYGAQGIYRNVIRLNRCLISDLTLYTILLKTISKKWWT